MLARDSAWRLRGNRQGQHPASSDRGSAPLFCYFDWLLLMRLAEADKQI